MAQGNKEFFDDLVDHAGVKALETTVGRNGFQLWTTKLPVIFLDFSCEDYTGDGRKGMTNVIREAGVTLGIDLKCDPTNPASALDDLVQKVQETAAQRGFNGGVDRLGRPQVVLLIDEYDAPVTGLLNEDILSREELLAVSKERLKAIRGVYSAVKALGRRHVFHLVFVTGVTKLAQASMFSGPNNFTSLLETHPEFSSLFCFTEEEVRVTYGPWIEANLSAFQPAAASVQSVLADMKEWYNGYWVHPAAPATLLNTFSVLSHLQEKKVTRAWTRVGPPAPAFVLRTLLGVDDSDLRALVDGTVTMSWDAVTAKRPLSELLDKSPNPEAVCALCMQAGLLTIKAAEPAGYGMEYALKIGTPNREVSEYIVLRHFEALVGSAQLAAYQGRVVAFAKALVSGEHRQAASKLLGMLELANTIGTLQAEASVGQVLFGGLYSAGLMHRGELPPLAVLTEVSDPEKVEARGRRAASDGMVVFRGADGAAAMEVIELKRVRTLADVPAALKDGVVQTIAGKSRQSMISHEPEVPLKSYFEICRDVVNGSHGAGKVAPMSQFEPIALAQQRGLVLVAVLPEGPGSKLASGPYAFTDVAVAEMKMPEGVALRVSGIESQGWHIAADGSIAVAWLSFCVQE
jgi:hypothetical protein